MAPDFQYFIWGTRVDRSGHSVAGQFLICLPLTLLLVWTIRCLVARPLALHLPRAGPFHLGDYQVLARPVAPGYWVRAALCALAGSFSHIFWDGFTHRSGWATLRFELLQHPLVEIHGRTLFVYKALQHSGTVFGRLFTLWLLYRIGRERLLPRWSGIAPEELERPAPPEDRRRFWLPCAGVALGGAVLLLLLSPYPDGRPVHYQWVGYILRVVACGFAGLCLSPLVPGAS